jgi:hypothetical protein
MFRFAQYDKRPEAIVLREDPLWLSLFVKRGYAFAALLPIRGLACDPSAQDRHLLSPSWTKVLPLILSLGNRAGRACKIDSANFCASLITSSGATTPFTRPISFARSASINSEPSSNSRAFLAKHPQEENADERETDYLAACSFFSRARNRASRSSLKMVLNSTFLLSQSFFVMTESVIAPL